LSRGSGFTRKFSTSHGLWLGSASLTAQPLGDRPVGHELDGRVAPPVARARNGKDRAFADALLDRLPADAAQDGTDLVELECPAGGTQVLFGHLDSAQQGPRPRTGLVGLSVDRMPLLRLRHQAPLLPA
jgi:hypothetical protein